MKHLSIILLLFVYSSLSQAYSSYTEDNGSQPATVSATLETSCKQAFENLEGKFAEHLSAMAFVKTAATLQLGEWKESYTTTESVSEARTNTVSVTSSLGKEFPPMIFIVKSTRTVCKEKKPDSTTTSTCSGSYGLSLDGDETKVYQKVIERRKGANPFKSFSTRFSFNGSSTTSCNFSSSLSVEDNLYFLAKPHLRQGMDLDTVQKSILKAYTAWVKNNLKKMEAK